MLLLPTDTCYGLAGSFTREDYEAIYEAKGRSTTKQLALLVRDYDDMKNYIEISDEQIDFLRKYPYPWSFLGRKKDSFTLPDWMDSEKYQMISIRVAKVCFRHREEGSDPESQVPGLLRDSQGPKSALEYPLFLTSANLSGEKESHTLEEAQQVFPGIQGIDGGMCDRPPSDIFSIGSDGELQYLRRNY